MGKRLNNIDWTEVALMMNAIEKAHECIVALTVTTSGQGHNGILHLRAEASFAVLPGSDLPRTVQATGDWPSLKAKTFEGMCYNLCWSLDWAITQAYEQMRLPAA